MAKVEIIDIISEVPGPLMEAIQDADPNLVLGRGAKCVNKECLAERELRLIVGVACLAMVEEVSQEIERLQREGKSPAGLFQKRQNLNNWAHLAFHDNLPKLKKLT